MVLAYAASQTRWLQDLSVCGDTRDMISADLHSFTADVDHTADISTLHILSTTLLHLSNTAVLYIQRQHLLRSTQRQFNAVVVTVRQGFVVG